MAKFSRPPKPSSASRVRDKSSHSGVPAEVEAFKRVYVFERRVLERFRNGADVKPYEPAKSLDGGKRADTPEEKERANQWVSVFNKLSGRPLEPSQYVRILFNILRSSPAPIPVPNQLPNEKMYQMVLDHVKNIQDELRQLFLSESGLARTSILIHQKGSGYSQPVAIYYTLLDPTVTLSPVFKYCLAINAVNWMKANKLEDSIREKLLNLAKRFEFLAAMDYSLFPAEYNSAYGEIIPAGFADLACNVVNQQV